jgi:hypothetical protein
MYSGTGNLSLMKNLHVQSDICVVGGGMAGLCAAIAAARHGATVTLIHDRPVYGGNASSEIRVGIIGADRCGEIPQARETGLLEEIRLRNLHDNPGMEYALWDLLLYDMVQAEPNIRAYMNTSCFEVRTEARRIRHLRAWQLTTESMLTVEAQSFVDCTGDGTLAALAGAEYRQGREGRQEFGETYAPAEPDARTMGMSLNLRARLEPAPVTFTPPTWANRFEKDEELPYGAPGHIGTVRRGYSQYRFGFWWVELGGEADNIHDTEDLKRELLRIALGVWDHIKNRGDHGADNYHLDWIQFLPGKRESRRIVGDYLLNQNDLEVARPFPDTVAYGGWTMDAHDPKGFYKKVDTTVFHPCASPYPIPFRCLYSRNIANLYCAGRNISATHIALSSTRVMGTCAVMGQAVGTAAALGARKGLDPREVGQQAIGEVQSQLLEDDCYLPGFAYPIPEVNRRFRLSSSHGDPAPLWNGTDRDIGPGPNALALPPGGTITLEATEPLPITSIELALDSDLSTQIITQDYSEEYQTGHLALPETLLPRFRVWVQQEGAWRMLHEASDNWRRYVRLPVNGAVCGVRLELPMDLPQRAGGWRVFRLSMRG